MRRTSNRAAHSDRTALLMAAFVSFGCLCFFALVARPEKQPSTKVSIAPLAPPQPPFDPPPPPPRIDPYKQLLVVPGRWASIDFKDCSYGTYKFTSGKKVSLNLKNGEYEYDFGDKGRGWFSLNKVYYFDVTGDLILDAIVDISHVECGASCDGGAHLLFIYSINADGDVKEIFQYETGSYAYGCGLQSITLARKEVDLEIFGRCPRPGMEDTGPGKGIVKDLTELTFRFSNKKFVKSRTEYVSTGLMDVRSYSAEVLIKEEPANVSRP